MKIGIITHYFNSTNYGGNLQAYALCKFLNLNGHTAEQISYDKKFDIPEFGKRRMLYGRLRKIAYKIKRLQSSSQDTKIKKIMKNRRESILAFNRNEIPHTVKCYHKKNIRHINNDYDVFIAGSDQVWHPKAVCGAYLLDFVQEGKMKLSYAASVATDSLEEFMKVQYRKALYSFDAISVRENDAVDMISALTPVKVEWVLDPVFLLSTAQWDSFCESVDVKENYLFCYFLGDDENLRKKTNEFARVKGLKIATIPYLNGKYSVCDDGFGDYILGSIDPKAFVSWIKNANCIFTDSFHATAFSVLFKKEVFVFPRKGHSSMGTRIRSILYLIDREDRFLTDYQSVGLEMLLRSEPIDYEHSLNELESMRNSSRDFLINNISKHILREL